MAGCLSGLRNGYFVEFAAHILLAFDFVLGFLGPVDEFLLEFLLEVVFGAFADMEGAVKFGDDVRFVLGKVYFLIHHMQLTIVLP